MSLDSRSQGLSETRATYKLRKFIDKQIDIERRRRDAQSKPMSKTSLLGSVFHQPLSSPIIPKLESSSEHNVVKKVFAKTCERWRLDEEQQWILLGYTANAGIEWRKLVGKLKELPRDAEQRAGFVIGISLGLSALFQENLEAELSWLNEPRANLEFNSALDYMLEGGMMNLIVVSGMVKRERGI